MAKNTGKLFFEKIYFSNGVGETILTFFQGIVSLILYPSANVIASDGFVTTLKISSEDNRIVFFAV